MDNKRTKGDLNEILFENRNKAYGAYALRRSHDNSVLIGLFITLSLILLMAGAPRLLKSFFVSSPEKGKADTTLVVLQNIFETKVDKPKVDPPKNPCSPKPPKGNPASFTPTDSIDTQKPDSNLLANNNPKGNPKGSDSIPDGKLKLGGGNGNDNGLKKKDPILVPDKNPEFPGGMEALMKFLSSNLKYPPKAAEEKVTGTVFVSFVVDENGKIKDITLLNDKKVGLGCDEEAMRVIKMMPDWTPGVHQNEKVAVLYKLPVRFKIK